MNSNSFKNEMTNYSITNLIRMSICTTGKYGYLRNVHGTFITYIEIKHIKNIGISKFENT